MREKGGQGDSAPSFGSRSRRCRGGEAKDRRFAARRELGSAARIAGAMAKGHQGGGGALYRAVM